MSGQEQGGYGKYSEHAGGAVTVILHMPGWAAWRAAAAAAWGSGWTVPKKNHDGVPPKEAFCSAHGPCRFAEAS